VNSPIRTAQQAEANIRYVSNRRESANKTKQRNSNKQSVNITKAHRLEELGLREGHTSEKRSTNEQTKPMQVRTSFVGVGVQENQRNVKRKTNLNMAQN
jgi:hypothetical protein